MLVALLTRPALEHALALSQAARGGPQRGNQLEPRKLGKQLQYADKAGIRFVAIRGEDEAARGVVAVKDLQRGEQFEVADGDLPRPSWRGPARSARARWHEHRHPAGRTSLTARNLVASRGRQVALIRRRCDGGAAADFLGTGRPRGADLRRSTGFGSNADKLLGAHRCGDDCRAVRSGRSPHIELQDNLIVTHAVCVGEPFAPEVVRAMLGIRINTLLRGHSGIRVQTVQALADMLNAASPVVPQLGSVGASGDLAPLSHLAIVLLGGGEASMASACLVATRWRARDWRRSRCRTRKVWR